MRAAFAELKLLPLFVAVFIFGVTATPGNVNIIGNIIATEKVIPENIGIAVGILFYVP